MSRQLSLLETYPQLIGYDTAVYDYFKKQCVDYCSPFVLKLYLQCFHRSHLCGLDINLTYPQTGGRFPSINLDPAAHTNLQRRDSGLGFIAEVAARHAQESANGVLPPRHEERIRKREVWKRDLSGRSNSSIDPYYGCNVWDEMVDYATNFTYPWSESSP